MLTLIPLQQVIHNKEEQQEKQRAEKKNKKRSDSIVRICKYAVIVTDEGQIKGD